MSNRRLMTAERMVLMFLSLTREFLGTSVGDSGGQDDQIVNISETEEVIIDSA